MSRPARGFFDDDDEDDAQESFQTDRAVHGDADSLDHDSLNARGQSPLLPPLPAQYRNEYDRGSSVATGDRTHAGRVSSVIGAAMGSSVRGGVGTTVNGYDSMRGDSPSLDDIIAGGIGAKKRGRNVQALLQAWQNEMGAPELLVFPVEIVERVVKDLARRVSRDPPAWASRPCVQDSRPSSVRPAERARPESPVDSRDGRVILPRRDGRRDRKHARLARAQDVYARADMEGRSRSRHAARAPRRIRRTPAHACLGGQLEQCPEYYLSQADVKHRLYPNEVAHAEGCARTTAFRPRTRELTPPLSAQPATFAW